MDMLLISNNKPMSLKTYRTIRIIITMVTAMIFSSMLVMKNFFIPVATLAVSAVVLLYLRSRVEEVLADERDYTIGGRAALLSMQVFAWIGALGSFFFYALRDTNPAYEPIGMTLAFSTCALLFLYTLIFRFYNHVAMTDRRLIFGAFALALILGAFVASARFLTGEDTWICQNGEWVMHGAPSFPAPEVPCEA